MNKNKTNKTVSNAFVTIVSIVFISIIILFSTINQPFRTNAVSITQSHKTTADPRQQQVELNTVENNNNNNKINSISGKDRPIEEILIQRDQLREGLVACKSELNDQVSRIQRMEKDLSKSNNNNKEGKLFKKNLISQSTIEKQIKIDTLGNWNLWFDADNSILSKTGDVQVKQHSPQREEKVVFFTEKWEGPSSTYATTLSFHNEKQEHVTRLYYRCYPGELDISFDQKTCFAESVDGKTFVKPKLNIFSNAYNAVIEGMEGHNFAPFIDTNPKAIEKNQKFKGVGGIDPTVFPYNTSAFALGKILKRFKQDPNYEWGLYGFHSNDGIKWTKTAKPLIAKEGLDSLNVILWSEKLQEYQMYGRFWAKCKDRKYDKCVMPYRRSVFKATSKNFYDGWSSLKELVFNPEYPSAEGLYTNAIVSLPLVNNFLIGFPKRFNGIRHRVKEHPEPGVSDTTIITSNGDGLTWNREFKAAWLRPGRSTRNWSQRSNMIASGIRFDKNEWSLYGTMHYQWDDCHMQRLSIRPYGFASVYGSYDGGNVVTSQIVFSDNIIKKMASSDDKSKLVLKINYATSAFGSIMIELLKSESKATNNDDNGKSSSDDVTKLLQSKTMYGDDLEEIVIWEKTKEGSGGGGDDIKDIILNSKKSGHMLFLKFNLEDADVFAWKFDV